jgi:DNA-binding NarL/FixJ family response regulator
MSSASHPSVRVIVVDDHPIYREGLRAILSREGSLTIVGEASSAPDAYTVAKTAKPDVAIVESKLDGTSGFTITRELRRLVPGCHVLILAFGDAPRLAEDALASGATGYIYASHTAGEVVEAIRTVSRGEPFLPTDGVSAEKADGLSTLSTREREIFGLAVGGLSNDNMAQHLKISVKTVETHRAHINRKLGVHSTAELVRYAARHGLLPR